MKQISGRNFVFEIHDYSSLMLRSLALNEEGSVPCVSSDISQETQRTAIYLFGLHLREECRSCSVDFDSALRCKREIHNIMSRNDALQIVHGVRSIFE